MDKALEIITDERAIDGEDFSLCSDFSAVGTDPEQNRFYVTYDRVLFRKIPEVVQTILESNGYVFNFENTLSCLEHLQLAIRTRDTSTSISTGSPCLVIGFPDKNNIGVLLKSFYQEISKYEGIIANYHAKMLDKESNEQLKQKITTLEKENKDLKRKVKNLTATISYLKSAHEHAITNQNTLPANMVFARVKSFTFAERTIFLHSKRNSFRAKLDLCQRLPEKNQLCIIKLDNERQVTDIFLYGEQGKEFSSSLCTVLQVDDAHLKLRDENNRKVYLFTALNENERSQLEDIGRGDKIIAYLHAQHIIKLIKLSPVISAFSDLMHEQVLISKIDLTDVYHADNKSA